MLTLFIAFLNLYAALLHGPAAADGPPALSKPLKSAWSYSTDELLDFSPAVHGRSLYLPLAGGKVVSVEIAGGNFKWRTEVGGEISAPPAADDEGVFVSTAVTTDARARGSKVRGVLRLLSPDGGVTVWVRSLEAPVRGSLAVSEGVLYAATSEGRLYAFEGRTGNIKWVRQNGSPFQTSPVVAGGLLFLGDETGSFFALNLTTGQPVWRYRTPAPLRAQPAVNDGAVFIGSAENVFALEVTTGRLLWRARASGRVQGVAAGQGGLVVTTLDNFVYKYSAAEGKRVWKRRLPARVTASPLVTVEGVLLSPLSGDEVLILHPDSGRKINSIEVAEDSNTSAAPRLSGDFVILCTRRGVYAYTN
ncbi:MAG TPA: PQQ-binding-like beta-propeller repeat protein [Pyrinomonadaceae bacterium]|nr:PQQ-binding-like beta-propeller repeat protein [Pyrinomonadaceae bacterium]